MKNILKIITLAAMILASTNLNAGPASPAPTEPGTPILCVMLGAPWVYVCGISD